MKKNFATEAKEGIKKIQNKIIQTIRTDGILPFTERPSEEMVTPSAGPQKGKLYAADLFSIFTADIIKEDVLFTR